MGVDGQEEREKRSREDVAPKEEVKVENKLGPVNQREGKALRMVVYSST